MRTIEWSPDGVESLNDILLYYMSNFGENISNNIYTKIIKEIETIKNEKIKTKRCQELMDIGIYDIYEAVVKPWKIYYKILNNNKKAHILFVLDARRNIEEILISKVIDNKI
ncbi:MAG: type II toxin-antitoxin system RelE/ParE family toxin [Treponema sp.]|nr:type II toxin-antitoxin system RelE/ParE family toxin [Treponema sp.]